MSFNGFSYYSYNNIENCHFSECHTTTKDQLQSKVKKLRANNFEAYKITKNIEYSQICFISTPFMRYATRC